jgi:phospholipid N-methyltransferase
MGALNGLRPSASSNGSTKIRNLNFLSEFARDHKVIGAVAPSSPFLAKELCAGLDIESKRVIVEYGPGTGSLTREILPKIAPGARYAAIELNGKMAQSFRASFPSVELFEGSAETLPEVLRQMGEPHADCIISGLPWTFFPDELQDRILDTTCACLKEGGTFTAFSYLHGLLLPQGQRFRKQLDSRFSKVSRSSLELRNLPPAFVYWCTK